MNESIVGLVVEAGWNFSYVKKRTTLCFSNHFSWKKRCNFITILLSCHKRIKKSRLKI